MKEGMNRRDFLVRAIQTSAMVSLGKLSFEERALLASTGAEPMENSIPAAGIELPAGKIGDVELSRLIIGGNLIAGFAHSRDLIYVSDLFKHYFTDDKVIETLQLSEDMGITTAVLRTDDHTLRILDRYWNQVGGKITWIAQTYPKEDDLTTNIQQAIDQGARGAFIMGGIADQWVEEGKLDLIGNAVDFIQQNGLIAGVGGHALDVPRSVHQAGIDVDFYFKTLNTVDYWSATPQETIDFMASIQKPWIAYKVLGAGTTHPSEGFKYAYENGADFICAGMFDFQIREDALIARDTLAGELARNRPWFS